MAQVGATGRGDRDEWDISMIWNVLCFTKKIFLKNAFNSKKSF